MKIKAHRTLLNLSQAQYGRPLGVSGATVSRWESGEMHPCPIKMYPVIRRFSCGLITWDDVYTVTGEETVNADDTRAG
jgi:DNA-binding XRE family transcriptional regulator